MLTHRKRTAKDMASAICFTALYVVFGLLSISPIIGSQGKTITAAAIMAPIMGIILGPYIGTLSASLGGIIGLFVGSFSPPSLVSGVAAASCAGMLYAGKRSTCAFVYFALLFLFGFYPFVGPVWLYPQFMWFQIAGFLVLVSPFQSMALKNLNSNNGSKVFPAFFLTTLTSTLAGQIAGSLTFELLSWPILIADVNLWKANWQIITFLYPLERTVIALGASFIGGSLHKVLKFANNVPTTGLQLEKKSLRF